MDTNKTQKTRRQHFEPFSRYLGSKLPKIDQLFFHYMPQLKLRNYYEADLIGPSPTNVGGPILVRKGKVVRVSYQKQLIFFNGLRYFYYSCQDYSKIYHVSMRLNIKIEYRDRITVSKTVSK